MCHDSQEALLSRYYKRPAFWHPAHYSDVNMDYLDKTFELVDKALSGEGYSDPQVDLLLRIFHAHCVVD